MANPTTNFGWVMPTSTDLVTDLPADFAVFGQAVDTSMADLKGGTTGQILAKATNTDMDFTWITNDVGDITAVNTTAPLAGGGTSGALTLSIAAATTSVVGAVQLSDSTSTTSSVLAATPTAVKSSYDLAAAAIPKSTVTTAGDVIYATGSSAVTRLGVGTTGQVLTVAGGVPSWATPSGVGKVLQVVSATYDTEVSNSTSTDADTGLTATITPSLSTSKILVLVQQGGTYKDNNNAISRIKLSLKRGSTTIQVANEHLYTNSTVRNTGMYSFSYLDSPSTTSATTYKTVFNNQANVAAVSVQITGSSSSIVLLEIGA